MPKNVIFTGFVLVFRFFEFFEKSFVLKKSIKFLPPALLLVADGFFDFQKMAKKSLKMVKTYQTNIKKWQILINLGSIFGHHFCGLS